MMNVVRARAWPRLPARTAGANRFPHGSVTQPEGVASGLCDLAVRCLEQPPFRVGMGFLVVKRFHAFDTANNHPDTPEYEQEIADDNERSQYSYG